MAAPLACDLTVFSPGQRERLRGLVQRVFDACLATEELADGYRLRFAAVGADDAMEPVPLAVSIAEWITLERLCCSCITFTIEFEDQRGPLAVRMTGQPGIKQFLLTEFEGKIADKLPRTASHDNRGTA
jgi:hypothetical protein